MDFDGIMVSDKDQRKRNTVWYHVSVEPPKIEFVETKTRVMVTWGWGGRIGEMLVK